MSLMSQIGYSGVSAAQIALNSAAQNIANVNTPGYSRLTTQLGSVGGQGQQQVGGGVHVIGVKRMSDNFKTQQLWRATTDMHYYQAGQDYLSSLEGVMAGEGSSLGTGLNNFYAALSAASSSPCPRSAAGACDRSAAARAFGQLAATMATVMYICGVVGNFGGGLLDQFLPQNWIPMFHHHASMMFIQIGIGLCFTALYFVVFRTLILRLNLKTPGREESEIKLYSKADYQAARGKTTAAAAPETRLGQAAGFLQALGGADNIESINNCATRLRIALVDMAKTQSDDVFKALGAHGVVRRGNGIQVIVGLHVPQVRDQLENLMKDSLSTEHTTMTEAVS